VGPNHAFHLIMSIATCGLWLPVWLIVAVTARRPQQTVTVVAPHQPLAPPYQPPPPPREETDARHRR
jgi:hypothetical protein